jgi:hypothetical protein
MPPKPRSPDLLQVWNELASSPGLARDLRAKSYAELIEFANTAARARMVEMVRNFKRGWAWHRARELKERT